LIFVTVGTARDFSRLVKKADEIGKEMNEKIIIQRGNTRYTPKNCNYFDFIGREKFENYIKKADIVVTHAGVGNIITSLTQKKPTVVIPRRKKFNEHKNDHQMDIAKELEKSERIIVCYDIERLEEKILLAKKIKIEKYGNERCKLEKTLKKFIDGVNK